MIGDDEFYLIKFIFVHNYVSYVNLELDYTVIAEAKTWDLRHIYQYHHINIQYMNSIHSNKFTQYSSLQGTGADH